MSQQLVVVLGDVVDSRDVADRARFQQTLEATLQTVNDRFEAAAQTPFQILKGIDEVGGVLYGLERVYDVVKYVTRELHPVDIRFAVARGTVDVGLDSGEIAAMDGPAFHAADRILDDIEERDRTFGLEADDAFVDVLLQNYVNLQFLVADAWTDKELEVITLYERLGTQEAVADRLDVTQQRVSSVIQDTNWNVINGIETDLRELFATYSRLLEDDDAV